MLTARATELALVPYRRQLVATIRPFMADQLSLKRLLTLLESPSESAALDFKETLDLNHPRDRVEFAKDVLAMANTGGGHIVVGVEDSTRKHVGLNEEALSSLREAKTVNDKIRKYTGGYVTVSVAQYSLTTDNAANTLILIYVPPASSKIPALDDGVFPEPGNPSKQRWTFRKGDVYIRKGDESVKVQNPEDLWPIHHISSIDGASAHELIESYSKRFSDSLARELPPLLPNDTEDEVCGKNLIEILSSSKDYLVLGPSGLGKTVHLKYFCKTSIASGELVLLCFCKRYVGGSLIDLLNHEVSRFTTAGAQLLLDAAKVTGLSAVVVIDGLNECHSHVDDLLKEIQAFRLRYSFRLILSSQTDHLPKDSAKAERVVLSPLSKTQKRLIYSQNAQVAPSADVDFLCEGFSSAYDLSLAGRCHKAGECEPTRVELYERYCRQALPKNTTVSEALARKLAARMGDDLSTFLARDDFERYSEEFLSSQNASLDLLDQLKSSRLVKLTDDIFSFEHDLLLDYLRAEHERRKPLPSYLSELAKPKNQALIPFLLPRLSDGVVLRSIFARISSYSAFLEIFAGHCGSAAKQALLADCFELIDAASADLPFTKIVLPQGKFDGPLPLFSISLIGQRSWSEYEVRLCDAIAVGLKSEELQKRFFAILDLTQWSLTEQAREVAKTYTVSFGRLWQIIVGQLDMLTQQQLLVFRVASRLREINMREARVHGFCLQSQLWERIRKNAADHFSLSILLEGLSHCWPDKDFSGTYPELARLAWDTKIHPLRLKTLHLLHQTRWYFEREFPEQIESIRNILSSFESKDLFLNSLLVEVQVAYGAIEPLMTAEQAVDEMRNLLAESLKAAQGEREAGLCDIAYGLISNQFEDIFQGAYYEGFEILSPDEQVELLSLAARSERDGFFSGWILNRLLKSNDKAALPIFELYASRFNAESSSPQHAAGAFAISIAGCARYVTKPVSFSGPDVPDYRAWQICGEMLFWTVRGRVSGYLDHDRIAKLWDRLRNEASLAAVDALYRLIDGIRLILYDDTEVSQFDLVAQWPIESAPILRDSLKNRASLTSIFRFGGHKDTHLNKYLIEALAKVNDKASIPLLTEISDDPELGELAIAALRKIRRSVE
jgi:hypothetical protein